MSLVPTRRICSPDITIFMVWLYMKRSFYIVLPRLNTHEHKWTRNSPANENITQSPALYHALTNVKHPSDILCTPYLCHWFPHTYIRTQNSSDFGVYVSTSQRVRFAYFYYIWLWIGICRFYPYVSKLRTSLAPLSVWLNMSYAFADNTTTHTLRMYCGTHSRLIFIDILLINIDNP